jgi:hypothetical protein
MAIDDDEGDIFEEDEGYLFVGQGILYERPNINQIFHYFI